jgi:hypothetical protein
MVTTCLRYARRRGSRSATAPEIARAVMAPCAVYSAPEGTSAIATTDSVRTDTSGRDSEWDTLHTCQQSLDTRKRRSQPPLLKGRDDDVAAFDEPLVGATVRSVRKRHLASVLAVLLVVSACDSDGGGDTEGSAGTTTAATPQVGSEQPTTAVTDAGGATTTTTEYHVDALALVHCRDMDLARFYETIRVLSESGNLNDVSIEAWKADHPLVEGCV